MENFILCAVKKAFIKVGGGAKTIIKVMQICSDKG